MFEIGPPDSLHTFHPYRERLTNQAREERLLEKEGKRRQTRAVRGRLLFFRHWNQFEVTFSSARSFACFLSFLLPMILSSSSLPYPLVSSRKEVRLVLGNLLSPTFCISWTHFLPPCALETRVKVGNDIRADVLLWRTLSNLNNRSAGPR